MQWMKDNRTVVLLAFVLFVNLFSIGLVLSFPIAKNATFAEPILKLSQIDGPRISSVAVSAVAGRGALCRDILSVGVWVFLLVAFVALLIFNLSYNFKGATKVQWFWETILTLAFLGFWFLWDTCRTNLWFPLSLIQIGIVIFASYLYFFEKKLFREKNLDYFYAHHNNNWY